jgi:hypothetical protein
MADVQIWYDQNDHTFTVNRLKNKTSGDYINNAVVQLTINDSAGSPVSGASWPLTLSYVTNSDGKYRVVAPFGLSMIVGSSYTAIITMVGDGLNGQMEIDLSCQKRLR